MSESQLIALLGFIKHAEMELSEAAYKAGDGNLATARHCIDEANVAIAKARAVIAGSDA